MASPQLGTHHAARSEVARKNPKPRVQLLPDFNLIGASVVTVPLTR